MAREINFMSRKPSAIDLDIWLRYGDNPPKLRRIIEAQLAHSQPLIEAAVRREIGEWLEKNICLYAPADFDDLYNAVESLKAGEPLEGGKG